MAFNFGAAALGFSRVLEDTKDRNLKKKLASQSFENDIKKIMLKSELDKGTQKASQRREMREQSKLLLQYLDPDVAKNIIGTGSLAAIKNAVEVAEKARANKDNPNDIIKMYNPGGIDTSGITEGNIKQASRVYLSEKFDDENLVSPTERKMYGGYEPDRVGYFPSDKEKKKQFTNFAGPIINIIEQQQAYITDGGSTGDEKYKNLESQKQEFIKNANALKDKKDKPFKFNPLQLERMYVGSIRLELGENAKVDNVGQTIEVSLEGNRPTIASKYIAAFESFKKSYLPMVTDAVTKEVSPSFKAFINNKVSAVNREMQETLTIATIKDKDTFKDSEEIDPITKTTVKVSGFDKAIEALKKDPAARVIQVNGNRVLWNGTSFVKKATGIQ
tara:strand:+ start:1177 stop:2343 length:1167 start_codon:yes stop_codon:yes gene_type:complete